MTQQAYNNVSDITRLLSQPWPANRKNGDYRKALREASDAELRRVICGFCGTESSMLTGPEGRAWFHHHKCSTPKLRLA